jgi:hypothetical protein
VFRAAVLLRVAGAAHRDLLDLPARLTAEITLSARPSTSTLANAFTTAAPSSALWATAARRDAQALGHAAAGEVVLVHQPPAGIWLPPGSSCSRATFSTLTK